MFIDKNEEVECIESFTVGDIGSFTVEKGTIFWGTHRQSNESVEIENASGSLKLPTRLFEKYFQKTGRRLQGAKGNL